MSRRRADRKGLESYYNEKGILIHANKDLCDCLDKTCCGCFFPCPKCRSTKCGNDCRQKRKYVYEYHDYVGTGIRIENKYAPA